MIVHLEAKERDDTFLINLFDVGLWYIFVSYIISTYNFLRTLITFM